jgi:hypothetical protein
MDHWFDRLSQPHTRRVTIKAAALAGAATLFPLGRLQVAAANQQEPCYKPCLDIARQQWKDDNKACDKRWRLGQFGAYVSLIGGLGPGALLSLITSGRGLSCTSTSELAWHQAVAECLKPQCGDPGLYPGGNAPVAICRDKGYVPCGPDPIDCCDSTNAECCQCKTKLICCRLGANCSCCGSSG